MYTEFYNLKEKPFNLTPSPRFLYLGEVHKEALALLTCGVVERKGFVLLTGEVGTGKTTMIHALLANLGKNTHCVYISNPLLSSRDFISYLAAAVFNRKVRFKSKTAFLIEFEGFLKKCLQDQKNFVLIIDEAHRLSIDVLEEIRLLSNLETADDKLINIFLAGQPELNEKLSRPECRALLQRISIRYHMGPLDLESTGAYISKRLEMAGSEPGNRIFSRSVIKALYQYSGGYPRMINILADNTLLLGYARGTRKIHPSMVRECYEDLQLEGSFRKVSSSQPGRAEKSTQRHVRRAIPWKWVIILVFLFAGAALAVLLLDRKRRHDPVALPLLPHPATVGTPPETQPEVKMRIERTPGELPTHVAPDGQPSTGNEISETPSAEPTQKPEAVAPIRFEDMPAGLEEVGDTSSGETVAVVKDGETLIELVADVYGRSDENILNRVQAANPEIRDINFIEVGQRIVFPPLPEADRGPIFTVHIASYRPFENARRMFLELLEQGYEAYIIPVHHVRNEKVFRITLGNFATARDADIYARKIRKENLSDYAEVIRLDTR